MNEHTLRIEKLAFGGSGLGYVAGKVCFVPFTAPGDTVRVRVVAEKRSFMTGEVVELIELSPLRVTPPCPVFGSCGGCNWQHLAYAAQTEAKGAIFADLLWRSGRVDKELIEPVLAAPEPYGYRARVQLKVRFIEGQLHIGFYRPGTHVVVDVPLQCSIASQAVNRTFSALQNVLPALPEPDKISQVDITTGDDEGTVLIFHYTGERPKQTVTALRNSWISSAADGLYLQSGRKEFLVHIAGPEILTYLVPCGLAPNQPEVKLSFAAGSFSQVNYRQNLALIATVRAWAGLTGNETVLDLYCGNGNLSIPLADQARSIVCIEDYGPSIGDALRNCGLNRIDNASCHSIDAVAGIEKLKNSNDRFDVVILDPPRTGAAELVRHIPALKPAKVIYVSCDPATLARDAGILGKLGYKVTKSRPVDMFPQTYHIESVTLFKPE